MFVKSQYVPARNMQTNDHSTMATYKLHFKKSSSLLMTALHFTGDYSQANLSKVAFDANVNGYFKQRRQHSFLSRCFGL